MKIQADDSKPKRVGVPKNMHNEEIDIKKSLKLSNFQEQLVYTQKPKKKL